MKILYHHRTRSQDGQSVHIVELIAALRRAGHEVRIVAPAAARDEEFGADAGLVAHLKKLLPKFVYELLELAYAVPVYFRLKRAYLEFRPDFLYERYNLFLPSGAWLKRRFGLPLLSEVNAPLAEERARFDGLFFRRLAAWSERYVWRRADFVLPVTDVLADYVRRAGVPESRIRVIPNGINPAEFPSRLDREAAKARLGLAGKVVLGFTGFIRDWHGLERVVDVMAAADPALALHFLVVGDGPAKKSIAARAASLGITDRITFTGLVGRAAIPDHVAAFDVALQPDVVPYASPLKLFEYLATGCAVLAPDTPNIREILADGRNAALFDPDDPEAFAAGLARLCGDADLRSRLGGAAHRLVDEMGLTWDKNARRVAALVTPEQQPAPTR